VHRPRRLRRSPALRNLVRETNLSAHDFILPLFVSETIDEHRPIASMPGVSQFSVTEIADQAARAQDLGLQAVLLFGIPKEKNEQASSAYAENGIVQKALRAIKKRCPDLVAITDVCLCEYMSHGHCGVTRMDGDHFHVLNDETVDLLAKTALSHAQAGADMVAPSDMMDGRIGAIRATLDEHGFKDIGIMSYAAKFASTFYGPFRDAAESPPQFGDRRSYQMDCANADEALREVALDIDEGADIVMVKPALPYIDI
jgi:porphobilinogen synthase